MRTPATAAREAVEGKDKTLRNACLDRWSANECAKFLFGGPGDFQQKMIEAEINSMSPEERRLYDIQEEK